MGMSDDGQVSIMTLSNFFRNLNIYLVGLLLIHIPVLGGKGKNQIANKNKKGR